MKLYLFSIDCDRINDFKYFKINIDLSIRSYFISNYSLYTRILFQLLFFISRFARFSNKCIELIWGRVLYKISVLNSTFSPHLHQPCRVCAGRRCVCVCKRDFRGSFQRARVQVSLLSHLSSLHPVVRRATLVILIVYSSCLPTILPDPYNPHRGFHHFHGQATT